MQQNPMTVITEILPGQEQKLKEYLGPIGKNINENAANQFSKYQHLHYCTFFIIPGDSPSPGSSATPSLLTFEANIDGGVKDFLETLMVGNPEFVNTVYSCCKDYPNGDTGKQIAYLLGHDYGANAFYVAHPGQTRVIIETQKQIRQSIEKFLDANRKTLAGKKPDEIRQAIVDELPFKSKPEPQPFLNRHGDFIFKGVLVALVLVLLGGLFGFFGGFLQLLTELVLAAAVCFAILLRWHEKRDKQDDRPWESPKEIIDAIQKVEDRQPQNHLTSVIEIKAGRFRLTVLRIVLFGISLVAKLVSTKGDLSGIVTIHFARWVILPGTAGGRKRLLFMSNYDGSWENYLGEFIDHASVGLTAVWSNTQLAKDRGFPDTQWLALRGGSRDEQRFKAFARNSQLSELIWYSAYIDLSVKNVANNRTIHEGVFSITNLAEWLKCL